VITKHELKPHGHLVRSHIASPRVPGAFEPRLDFRVVGAMSVVEHYGLNTVMGASYDVLPDGRFVMIRGSDPWGEREIVLVQNFFEEARRLTMTR
jgi:hypothetical protein